MQGKSTAQTPSDASAEMYAIQLIEIAQNKLSRLSALNAVSARISEEISDGSETRLGTLSAGVTYLTAHVGDEIADASDWLEMAVVELRKQHKTRPETQGAVQ